MNNNLLLLGLLFGALFLFRRPNQQQQQLMHMGGEGTGYAIDVWGDEG